MPRSQKDQGFWIPRIQDRRPGRVLDLISSFSLGIIEILDPVTATMPWDPRDLGSRTEKILLDLGDPGYSLGKLSWDLRGLGSCTTISPYLEDPLHPMKFCLWFPISERCLNLRTVNIFNHILIQPFCVDLKTSSPCWFLHMFFYYRGVVGRMCVAECELAEMNTHFISSSSMTD